MSFETTPIDIDKMAASIGNLTGKVALITGELYAIALLFEYNFNLDLYIRYNCFL